MKFFSLQELSSAVCQPLQEETNISWTGTGNFSIPIQDQKVLTSIIAPLPLTR